MADLRFAGRHHILDCRYRLSAEVRALLCEAERLGGETIHVLADDQTGIAIDRNQKRPDDPEPYMIVCGVEGRERDFLVASAVARLLRRIAVPAHERLCYFENPAVEEHLVEATMALISRGSGRASSPVGGAATKR